MTGTGPKDAFGPGNGLAHQVGLALADCGVDAQALSRIVSEPPMARAIASVLKGNGLVIKAATPPKKVIQHIGEGRIDLVPIQVNFDQRMQDFLFIPGTFNSHHLGVSNKELEHWFGPSRKKMKGVHTIAITLIQPSSDGGTVHVDDVARLACQVGLTLENIPALTALKSYRHELAEASVRTISAITPESTRDGIMSLHTNDSMPFGMLWGKDKYWRPDSWVVTRRSM